MAQVIRLQPREPLSHVHVRQRTLFDQEVDGIECEARRMALSAVIGFAATSEARHIREAARVLDVLARRGEIVVVDSDPTPAHGIRRPL